MKNFKHITFFAILVISVTTFYQCSNDEGLYTPISEEDTFANFDELHDSISKDTIKLQILDPAVETILTGDEGIRLVFPANSCTLPAGAVAVAPFTVELIEIFKRGEMIAQNIQTFADDAALISGGMLWVRVTDANGAELTLNGVQAILPYQTDAAGYENSMQYFTGENQNAPSGPVLSWGEGNSDLGFDSEAGANGEFTIWNIMGGWSNCDAFNQFTGQAPTQFSVKVSNVTNFNNTKVFFALDEFSTVAALTTPVVGGLKTYDNSIATGATGKVIAISLVEGQLQFGAQDVTVAGNDEFTLEVQPGTLAQLETILGSLD